MRRGRGHRHPAPKTQAGDGRTLRILARAHEGIGLPVRAALAPRARSEMAAVDVQPLRRAERQLDARVLECLQPPGRRGPRAGDRMACAECAPRELEHSAEGAGPGRRRSPARRSHPGGPGRSARTRSSRESREGASGGHPGGSPCRGGRSSQQLADEQAPARAVALGRAFRLRIALQLGRRVVRRLHPAGEVLARCRRDELHRVAVEEGQQAVAVDDDVVRATRRRGPVRAACIVAISPVRLRVDAGEEPPADLADRLAAMAMAEQQREREEVGASRRVASRSRSRAGRRCRCTKRGRPRQLGVPRGSH